MEFLITLVSDHPMLYDPTDPLHKDTGRQRLVWIEIAETLGLEAGKCKYVLVPMGWIERKKEDTHGSDAALSA